MIGRKTAIPTDVNLLVDGHWSLIHRDLSWLQFNERVLAEARCTTNPLLERLKFLAISANNLDEFFLIRFSSIQRAYKRALNRKQPSSKRLGRIRQTVLDEVSKFSVKQRKAYSELTQELAKLHFELIGFQEPKSEGGTPEAEHLLIAKTMFDNEVLPQLGPPQPLTLQNLNQLENLKMAVVFGEEQWLPIARELPLVYKAQAGNKTYFCFLDYLLHHFAADALRLNGPVSLFRLTRDGDVSVDVEEDPETIPDMVRHHMSSRERGQPLRLQTLGKVSERLQKYLLHAFHLEAEQLFATNPTLYLHGLWQLIRLLPEANKLPAHVSYPPFTPLVSKTFHSQQPAELFNKISIRDLLLHHPYDSFDAYVRWIEAACKDPQVTMIQQTVYRMDALSPVIEALKGAAKSKRVRVIIELRARFDELNNLRLADELRKAGVEVAFGLSKLKIHAKIALVSRKEGEGIRHYTHLSTGNYNATTARQYEDFAILTANPSIGSDAAHFFDLVCRGELPVYFKNLVPAPTRLRRVLLKNIEVETAAAKAGKPARIFAKVNALIDEVVIEALYRASQAGVQVDLLVRGACSLIPQVAGLSDNIRVISVVDRYLEHSRIYYFASTSKIFLSSADWMPRNFFSRLELAFPVQDAFLQEFIRDFVIPAYLNDQLKGWELKPSGQWQQRTTTTENVFDPKLRAQFYFEELVRKKYRDTPLSWRYRKPDEAAITPQD